MPDSPPAPNEETTTDSPRRPKATRIDKDSIAFRWIVPIALILLVVVTVFLFVAAIAVIFDIFPRG